MPRYFDLPPIPPIPPIPPMPPARPVRPTPPRIEDLQIVADSGETGLQETGNGQDGAQEITVHTTNTSIYIYFAPTNINIITYHPYPNR